MLVLSRKVGERILIGNNIAVTVVRITGGGVRLGIDAPPELAVVREELQQALEEGSLPAPTPVRHPEDALPPRDPAADSEDPRRKPR